MYKIRKRGALILLIILVLALSGCKGGKLPFGKKQQVQEGALEQQVYRGNQGLEMRFTRGLPPDKLFDTGDFHALVELINRGTYEVRGRVFLGGIDPNFLGGMDFEKEFGPIEPKSKFIIEGGFDTVEFESPNIYLPEGTDAIPVDLIVTSCYDYRTLANPVVCVDPNRENIITDRKACTPGTVSLSGGQGAPVAVSNVRAETTGEKAFFRIQIANVGGGQIVNQFSLGSCPYALDYDDIDEVSYNIKLSDAPAVKCSPRSPVRLTKGRATITCAFDIPSQFNFAYLTPLQIELHYGYLQSVSKKVRLVHVE